MKNKYESEMLQVIHEDVKGMQKLGIVTDSEMRKFDKLCLNQEPKKTSKTTISQSSSGGTKPTVRISAKGTGC